MQSNPLLKWLLIPMALLLVFVGIKLFSSNNAPAPATGTPGQLTAEEMKALGITGDTPRDTVATLVAQVKQLRGELQTALGDSRQQKAENERLRAREGSLDQRIDSAFEGERRRLQQERDAAAGERQQTQGLMRELERRLDGLSSKEPLPDLPVGLGLGDGEGKSSAGPAAGGMRWIEPDDGPPEGATGAKALNHKFPGLPSSFGPAPAASPEQSTASAAAETGDRTPGTSRTKPVYTIPADATLIGSTAMTALIGRVPVDGTVNDPYPFKVLIGADNLTANGIELPDVAGAVASGTASGDWTMSCVRGQIRSITFVFRDGTVRTVPEDGERRNRQQGGTNTQNGLGWISDPEGVPCVLGERHSNAQQYLGTQALITAAGAGMASMLDKGGGRATFASSDGSVGTVGIGGNEAISRILAGGVQDMSQWVNRLYGQAFAAVYVKPGARVALHLEQALHIDYDPRGRRIDHQLGGAHAAELD